MFLQFHNANLHANDVPVHCNYHFRYTCTGMAQERYSNTYSGCNYKRMNSFYCFFCRLIAIGMTTLSTCALPGEQGTVELQKGSLFCKILLSIRNHQILRYYLRYEHIRLMFDIIAAFYYKLLTIKRKNEAGGIGRLNNNRQSVRISSPTS